MRRAAAGLMMLACGLLLAAHFQGCAGRNPGASLCRGAAMACERLDESQCAEQAGCTLLDAWCTGTPTPCELLDAQDLQSCGPGCRWCGDGGREFDCDGAVGCVGGGGGFCPYGLTECWKGQWLLAGGYCDCRCPHGHNSGQGNDSIVCAVGCTQRGPCVGTATLCEAPSLADEQSCKSQRWCEWDTERCQGNAQCSFYDVDRCSQAGCALVDAGTGLKCVGDATPCEAIPDRETCHDHGCRWE